MANNQCDAKCCNSKILFHCFLYLFLEAHGIEIWPSILTSGTIPLKGTFSVCLGYMKHTTLPTRHKWVYYYMNNASHLAHWRKHGTTPNQLLRDTDNPHPLSTNFWLSKHAQLCASFVVHLIKGHMSFYLPKHGICHTFKLSLKPLCQF